MRKNIEAVEEVTKIINTKKDQNGGKEMVIKSYPEITYNIEDEHLENEI